MSLHAGFRHLVGIGFRRTENTFDLAFGPENNPLRHLGAMGMLFLWILVATGLYLYIVIDTSIDGVFQSINYLSEEQWFFGGILRSLHRYATDGFVIVMFLHILREWVYDRYSGFRLFTWMTGIPLVWLVFMSAIGGYWIVWDQVAQFSATATAELIDWLNITTEPVARNFQVPEAISDRFFTFLVYIHIGFPLFLILGVWAHVNRISRVDHIPRSNVISGTFGALLLLSLMVPAMSTEQANLLTVPLETRLDWLILFINPLTYQASPATVWMIVLGFTTLLLVLPLLPGAPRQAVAKVDPPNCNGCRRCYVDCPYEAVIMAPHPDKPNHQIAIVDADNCASCGICAGSCPSSTPFRSSEKLVTGIDMPQQPINAMRQELETKLSMLSGKSNIMIFGCQNGLDITQFAADDTASMTLICSGMLPPSFVEYALRSGADGVVITGCRPGGCPFRFGNQWTSERLEHQREPHLRNNVPQERVRQIWADQTEFAVLSHGLNEFRKQLATLSSDNHRLSPYHRRNVAHGH